jgi:hypothetical protein
MIEFNFNDGGRQAAGFKGTTGDCVTRAIVIVTGKPYKEVYDALNELAQPFNNRKHKRIRGSSNSRLGVHKPVYHKYLLSFGMKWTPTMLIGQGCKVHLRADELPAGKLIVRVSKHLTTVIDGVVNDTWNPAREVQCTEITNGVQTGHVEERCVYGYYTF